MEHLPVSHYAIDQHPNCLIANRTPAPALSRVDIADAPAGSTVLVHGDYKHYARTDDSLDVDVSEIVVTVIEYLRLDDGQMVLIGNVEVQPMYRHGLDDDGALTETIKGFFHQSLVLEVLSKGTAAKTRVMCQSQWYREFENEERGFPAAMFTPGTRVLLNDSVKAADGSQELTVARIAYNGPDSVVMLGEGICAEGYFAGKRELFHIAHADKIISHKTGPLAWDAHSSNSYKFQSERQLRGGKHIAGKSKYVGCTQEILMHASAQWLPDQMGVCYDLEKLGELLWNSGVFQLKEIGNDWYIPTVVSKKKLKRAVRRLQGKISTSARKRQKEEDDENNRMMEQDMRYTFDRMDEPEPEPEESSFN